VLDFTSALYLGLEHPSWSLPAWPRLSLGKPAAMAEPPGASGVERDLAALVGCERALLGPSTLHLFLDLFAMLARPRTKIFLDRGAYAIGRWGVERASAAGAGVESFPHFDPGALRDAIRKSPGTRPVIVTDGFCPGCGRPAPLREYAGCAKSGNGLVVVDDTQALGVLGHSPDVAPYGIGGGGSIRHLGISSQRVVVVNSLAKGFGVPVAMLGGSTTMVEGFVRCSATRVHCSPPSAAVVAAAGNAIELNRECGSVLRFRLAGRVARLRRGLRKFGLTATGSLFPVQPLQLEPGQAYAVHAALLERGVRTVLHRSADDAAAKISFIVTARHEMDEIDETIEVLRDALARAPGTRSRKYKERNGR
jgi:8-amino-7-oxononanoate synthase